MFGFTGRPSWRTVTGGSSRYVERLTAPIRDCLRLGSTSPSPCASSP